MVVEIREIDVSPDPPDAGGSAVVSVTVAETSTTGQSGESCVYSLTRAGWNIDVELYVEGVQVAVENVCVPIYVLSDGTATAVFEAAMPDAQAAHIEAHAVGGFTGNLYDTADVTVQLDTGDDGDDDDPIKATTIGELGVTRETVAGEPVTVTGDVCCGGVDSCDPDEWSLVIDGETAVAGSVDVVAGCERVITYDHTFDVTGQHVVELRLVDGVDDTVTVLVSEPEDDGDDGDGNGNGEQPDGDGISRAALLAAVGGAFYLAEEGEDESKNREVKP